MITINTMFPRFIGKHVLSASLKDLKLTLMPKLKVFFLFSNEKTEVHPIGCTDQSETSQTCH